MGLLMKSRLSCLLLLSFFVFNAFGVQSSLALLQRGVNVERLKSDKVVFTSEQKIGKVFAKAGAAAIHKVHDVNQEENIDWEAILYGAKAVCPYLPYELCLFDAYDHAREKFPFEGLAQLVNENKRQFDVERRLSSLLGCALPGKFHGVYESDSASPASSIRTGDDSMILISSCFDKGLPDDRDFTLVHEAGHIYRNHGNYHKYVCLFLPLISEVVIQGSNVGLRYINRKLDQKINQIENSSIHLAAEFCALPLKISATIAMSLDTTVGRYVVPVVLYGLFQKYCEVEADLFAVKTCGTSKGVVSFCKDGCGRMRPSITFTKSDIINAMGGYRKLFNHLLLAHAHPPDWMRAWYCGLYSRYWLGNEG